MEGENLVEVSRRGLLFALYPGIFHTPLGDKSGLLIPENFSIGRCKSWNALQCLYPQYKWLHTLTAAIAPCCCQATLPMLLLGQERNASGLSPSLPFSASSGKSLGSEICFLACPWHGLKGSYGYFAYSHYFPSYKVIKEKRRRKKWEVNMNMKLIWN